MQIEKKIKKMMGIAIFCSTFIIVKPADAYIWPTIDIAEIASIVNDVTNGFSKITSATAQIKNYISTIESIGDQASLLQKYAKDVKSSLVEVKSNITKTLGAVNDAADGVINVANDVNDQVNNNSTRKTEDTENIIENTEILIDEGETEEIVQAKIEETKEDIIESNNESTIVLEQAQKHVITQSADSQKIVNDLVEKVIESKDLDETTKSNLQAEAKQLNTRINNYNIKAEKLFNDIEKEQAENNKKVIDAYDEYSGMVKSYYKGSIKKDDLSMVGSSLKKKVEAAQTKMDDVRLTELTNESQEISKDINKLKEAILDSVANNKEYSDEEEPDKTSALDVKKSLQYAYHLHKEYHNTYLTGIYADKNGEDESFLISKELVCEGLKLDDINDDGKLGDFIDKLRHCVIRAKAEKNYFCKTDDIEILKDEKCDPYVQEKELYGPYKKEGVYKHILEDYEVENITNLDKTKQYASSWLDEGKEDSPLKSLSNQLKNINDERNTHAIVSTINLEAPKLWSYIRRADALVRAKEVIGWYGQQDNLYLDKRDEDFTKSEQSQLGVVDGKNVISNEILYGCSKNGADIKGNNISVEEKDKYDSNKIEKAEKNIKKCLYRYAAGASFGTTEGEVEFDQLAKGEWEAKRVKAYNDSMFHTFVLSTINNYKSSRDYYKNASEDERNIITLVDKVATSGDLRADYAAGAEIINYSTRQLLSIIDADAQELQSEIIADIQSMRYDYFDTTVEKGE